MSEAAAIASCVRNGEAPGRHHDGIRVQRLLFLQVYSPSIFGRRESGDYPIHQDRHASASRDEDYRCDHLPWCWCRMILGWVDARIAHSVIQSMTYGICELSKT
jgi:hypothetical protein